MNIQVTPHTITLTRTTSINAGEYNITPCVFEFSEEYSNLTKEAVFSTCSTTVKTAILNNQCIIPFEVLQEPGNVLIGVFGYDTEDDELILRYSPKPVYFNVVNGSFKEGNDPDLPAPTEWELVLEQINEAIEETNNLNITVEKTDHITTITLTKKDGTQETVQIEDGKSLEFNWRGTELGIRQEGQSQYQYVNLKGDKGEAGLTPSIQIGTVVSGATPSVTRTGTDENPVLNFVLQKGDTGNGISSIEKTSTSGLVDTYTVTYTNGNTTTFDVSNGNGIDRIEKTATVGNKDTYTIYFTNGSTTTYEISNGEVTREELEEEVDRLSMIYNAFPTTTGEGEEPSINGTAEVPFKEIGLKGNTSQESTTGKNLFDGILENGTYTSTGVKEATTLLYRNKNIISVKPETTYTFSINGTNQKYVVYFYDNTQTFISWSSAFSTGVISTPSNAYYMNFRCFADDYDANFLNLKVQLELGENATTYEPYTGGNPAPSPDYPYPVNVVTGDNEVKVEGKNLWSKNNATLFVNAVNDNTKAKLETKDNRNCLRYSADAGYGSYPTKNLSLDMTFKENTQYTISVDFYKTDTTTNLIDIEYTDGTSTQIGSSITINTWLHYSKTSEAGKTIKYIRPRYMSGEIYIDLDTFMVEEGSTATTYEPYQSQTYPINLGSMELCKIGDYQDYLYKENGIWYKYGAIGKTEVNLTGNVGSLPNNNKYTVFFPTNKAKIYGNLCYCNKANYNQDNPQDGQFYQNVPNVVYVGNSTDTLATLKQKYDGSLLYYVLNTPTITEITDTTLIEQLDNLEKAYSYDTQTNISQTNQDKPFIISYEAILSLKNVLNS